MGPSVWPDIFALFSLASRTANVNNLSVSALGSLPLPAMRYVSAAQSYLAFGFQFRVNVYVDVDLGQEGGLLSSYAHAGVANLRGTISGKQCCCGNETELPRRDFFGANFFTFSGSSKSQLPSCEKEIHACKFVVVKFEFAFVYT